MIEQKFGARRCRDTRKPLADQCPDVIFYRCRNCKSLFAVTGEQAQEEKEITCCQEKAEILTPVTPEAVESKVKISYQITGGYNDNAVKVSWDTKTDEYVPEWIYLKTFTGGYLKYVMQKKRKQMVFALADTDAFAYCDEDPCLECVFRCKRGFVIYAFAEAVGLVEIPLDKMTAHWQSGAENTSR